MKRYEPKCRNGTLFLVAEDDEVEVGTVEDVVAAVGSETYAIEYDERQRKQPWLETDDGVLKIDVREAVTTMTHAEALIAELRRFDTETEKYGLSERTVKFADLFVAILERQGSS